MASVDIVARISQRPQGTSRPGSGHIRLGSVKPQSKSSIPSGEAAAEPDSSMLLTAMPVEPVSSVEPLIFYPCILSPANYHVDIGFVRRDGDGSCSCRRMDIQTVFLHVGSR